jgi:hypothetical protein
VAALLVAGWLFSVELGGRSKVGRTIGFLTSAVVSTLLLAVTAWNVFDLGCAL